MEWTMSLQDTAQWISIIVCLFATAALAKNQSEGFGNISDLLEKLNKD